MARFKLGDEVQMRDGTAIWGQYPTLRMARGHVVGTVPAGTEADRITVEYPDGTKLPGVDAGMFQRPGTA